MKYSTVKELLNNSVQRSTIRTLDAYLMGNDSEYLMESIVLEDTTRQEISEYFAELFDECHEIPDDLRFYIDYGAWERDLLLGGDYSVLDHKGNTTLIRNV